MLYQLSCFLLSRREAGQIALLKERRDGEAAAAWVSRSEAIGQHIAQ